MDEVQALSTRRDMFLDERGAGLRVTWHPERDLVVLSVWHEDSCVGTFRMLVQDVPRLSELLAAALGDWVDQSGGPGTEGTAGAGPGAEGPVRGGPGAKGTAGAGPGAKEAAGAGTGIAGEPGGGPGSEGSAGGGLGAGDAEGVGAEGEGSGRGAVVGLSVQQRLRLSRPVLRLRGLQHRRRRPA